MTTGHSLTERAAQADSEHRAKVRDSAQAERERALDAVIDRWNDKYYGAGEKLGVDCPERDQFTFRVIAVDGHRINEVRGWAVRIDGVELLVAKSEGLHVVVTCPGCGAERAEHVSSVDQLGRLLRVGHGFGHHCRATETRSIAYAIGTAARNLKSGNSDPAQLVAEAFELHGDLIDRLRFGR